MPLKDMSRVATDNISPLYPVMTQTDLFYQIYSKNTNISFS